MGTAAKKTISPTARTIHPSLPHPQRLPGTFESGRRVEVLLHTQVSDLRHTSIKEVSAPFLQNPDGRPQGRDGDAGPGLQGQQEGYLLKNDDNDKKKQEAHHRREDRIGLSRPDPLQSSWDQDVGHSPPSPPGTKGKKVRESNIPNLFQQSICPIFDSVTI